MDRLELLDELDRMLPPVDKPEGPDLSFHPSGCDACDMLRTELAIWPGRKLPMEALFWLHDDMSSLSAAGWRWALPSYLRLVLESPPDEINLLLGFLILNLNPSPAYREDTRTRLGALDAQQLGLLLRFMQWCGEQPWLLAWGEDIDQACSFLDDLRRRR
ncbi:hypothetical protein NRL37_07785 [Metapseudomonas otitidis]|uniref:hypothetical protein n=1 Tax=Metapseudomonas otitidis TaxID=319939 RepID=UPI00227D2FB3|nr:hypothetical protein [Pseudomonas otitidis]WAF87349.1 hypothetical protein NRL37_07785 [Pseudomonas otitidis]